MAVLAEFLVNHIADTLSIQSPLEALSYAALQYASVVLDVVYWNGGLPDERLMELEFAAFVAGLRGNDQVWSPSVRDLLRSRLKT